MDLRGKNVIVTGGARGLGRAMVEKLAAIGASVTIFDLDPLAVDGVRPPLTAAAAVQCDVSDYPQVLAATARYHDTVGAADVLINNAGIIHSSPLVRIGPSGVEKHDPGMWNRILAADLSSVFYMTVCIVERMIVARTKGVIVNISSVAAAGNAGQSAYSAAKAGVNALTVVWAKELGPLGIRVIAIAPGFMDTESTRDAVSDSSLRERVKNVPLRRLGTPEEMADAVLAAIQNDFFNGKILEVDGGLRL